MRFASTSRRSGSSSLLSFSPRIGRCGDRITAAANTAPNSAPRPTSSAPATAWKPRARNSRSNPDSQRNLPAAVSGRMKTWRLLAFSQPGSLALQPAEIVEFGPPGTARADHVDVIDHLGMDRENTFDSLPETDFPNRDALAQPGVVPGNHGAFKRLQPLLVAFLDLHVDPDGVAGTKGRDVGTPVLLDKLRQHCVLHDNFLNFLSYRRIGKIRSKP